MEFAAVFLCMLLICVGVCAIIDQIRQLFFDPPKPQVIRLDGLNAENAEFRLRSAIFRATGSRCIIHAVCTDDEAYRICRTLSLSSSVCVVCSKKEAP